jgi:pyrroline-5-carboxylate reductase
VRRVTLGFLGTGTITSAIVTGLSSAPYDICLSPRNADVAAALVREFPRVSVAASNQDVLDRCEIVVIAVRPQITEEVLAHLRFRGDHRVISLVSGFSVRRVAGLVAPATQITRAVPLPSVARRRCPTAIYPADVTTIELFSLLGAAFAVESEDAFDVLCTATATMAAWFAFAATASSWLEHHGIPEAQARDYIARLFAGLAQTAVESPDRSFAELAADHATRGGTNEQVVNHLRGGGVFARYEEALDAILRRVTAAPR